MKRLLIFCVILATISAEELETRKTVKKSAAIDLKNDLEARTEDPMEMTVKVEIVRETTEAPKTTQISEDSTTEKVIEASSTISSTSEAPQTSSTTELLEIPAEVDSNEEIPMPDAISANLPPREPPKRKVLYLNQRQNGKLNVHLELSDVSVIVIPKNKDPQLSLLNLLFKSAQKSKKKEDDMKVDIHHHDAYSKYKHSIRPSEESYHNLGSTGMPFIESRAPYKVDISSTLGQQPIVDIVPNAHPQHAVAPQFQSQFARSPIMQLLKPSTYTIQSAPGHSPHSNRIFKRSIDSRLLGIEDEIPTDDDELTESVFNSLDRNGEDFTDDRFDGSEFVLLGATENCGPGRRRNSYQICVAVTDDE